MAALEAATAARQAAARRRAAVEGREAAIRATRVGADWLLEAEQRVLRAADRRPTLEEREGIAETVERRIREHLDSRLEALAATVVGAELLEEMQADASAATLAGAGAGHRARRAAPRGAPDGAAAAVRAARRRGSVHRPLGGQGPGVAPRWPHHGGEPDGGAKGGGGGKVLGWRVPATFSMGAGAAGTTGRRLVRGSPWRTLTRR